MRPTEKIFSFTFVWLLFFLCAMTVYAASSSSSSSPGKKNGPSHLQYDQAADLHRLTLCAGQTWENESMKPFRQLATRSDSASVASGEFLPTKEAQAVNFSITGSAVGITKVYFDMEVIGIAPKTTSVFEVTVNNDCGAAPKAAGSSAQANLESVATPKWDWPYPTFKNNSYYSGAAPDCYLADGDLANSGDMSLLTFTQVWEYKYYVQSGENSVWTKWFDWKEGKFGVRKVTTTNKEVAIGEYSASDSKFIVETFKPGTAEIKVEFSILPPGFKGKKSEIKWKTLSLVVHVLPSKIDGHPLCTGEKLVPVPPPPPEVCQVSVSKTPAFKVPAPKSLTSEEAALAASIQSVLKRTSALPSICTSEMIERQAKKVAHAFYSTPAPKGRVSCVDCSKDVASAVIDALADEEVGCIKVTRVGRLEPVLKLALHTVSAVGPACTPLNDDWIVIDTWYWLGQVGGKHRHRVSNYGDWRYDNNAEWGADRPQQNLPESK